jgi:signal peptidase I
MSGSPGTAAMPAAAPARHRPRAVAFARDAAVVATIAALLFQALRRFVADRYIVPSGSMQPTLYGDPEHGDVVLVDKLANRAGLRRYDLAVYRGVEDPQSNLVKRAVAFGDDAEHCCLELRDGDLWLGPNSQQLARDVKEPFASRDLRVPWFEWPVTNGEPAVQFVAVPAGTAAGGPIALPSLGDVGDVRRTVARATGPGALRDGHALGDRWFSTVRAIDDSFLDALGYRRRGRGTTMVDVGFDGELELDGASDLFCVVVLRPDAWTFHWQLADGVVELWRHGDTVAEHRLAEGAAPPGPRRVEFGYLDGRFFFGVDGRADRLWCEPRRPEWTGPDAPEAQPLPRNLLHVGAVARAARIVRCTLFRDLYWFRERMVGAPYAEPTVMVGRGEVYLLGDNESDSRDSRAFGPVPDSAFVGRPRAVIAPWSRRRWLDR